MALSTPRYRVVEIRFRSGAIGNRPLKIGNVGYSFGLRHLFQLTPNTYVLGLLQ